MISARAAGISSRERVVSVREVTYRIGTNSVMMFPADSAGN
jgi:hypothetical protein